MPESNTGNKTVWMTLIIVGFCALVVAFIILSSSDKEPQPADQPDVVTPTKPKAGDIAPLDPTAEPIDPVEQAAAVIDRQTVTVPGLEMGMESGEAENLIEQLLKPETSEGNQTFDMRLTPQTENGYTLLAVADNMLDDSVKAQEITAVFRPGQREAFVLAEYSSRVKCRRGANKDQWQIQVCP